MASITNVVLVHGGFVDGAGWAGVYKILKSGGYRIGTLVAWATGGTTWLTRTRI